jgi:membrane protein insertase Oxa1/YidC/SpoIIIJ
MFGNTLNLLPFLMTIITIYSTITFKNNYVSLNEVKKQKGRLYSMAIVFFVLFYPFPSVMVLYWALANILDFIERQYVGA